VGLRGRVAAVALAAATVPLAVLYWWSHDALPELLLESARADLERQARGVAGSLPEGALSDPVADRLGETTGRRVTLVGADGSVLGDSGREPGPPGGPGRVADRPEVVRALGGDVGFALRREGGSGPPRLHVAVPHPEGAVRLSLPLSEALAPARSVRRWILGAGLGSLLLVLLLARRIRRFVEAPIRRIGREVEAMASGRTERRRRPRDEGALGEAGRALDRLADRLARAREEGDEVERLSDLLDRLEEGLALLDEEGNVVRSNRALRGWVARDEVRGRRLDTLFRDPRIGELLERAVGGEAASTELELGDRTTLVSLRPHEGGCVAVLRDLTRLRRLEGVRREFVANASHELKTPLTTVLGFAETLTDPDLPREHRVGFAERILANAGRMRAIIDDLLDLSRLESGSWEPDPGEVEIEFVARHAWEEMGPGVEEKGLSLELSTEGAPRVWAGPDSLRIVLRNLLDNAVRYAPEGTAVRVASGPADRGTVEISVSDSGPGIPGPDRERIFERFYRVDPGRARDEGGTGLGLAIVKHLVEGHGGEVGVRSRVGEGTTVWLTLPAPGAGPGNP